MAEEDEEAGIPRAIRTKNAYMYERQAKNGSDSLRVYLARHGQSQNNLLQKELEEKLKNGAISQKEALLLWFEGRSDDADLTSLGIDEAAGLAASFRSVIVDNGGAALGVSPMLRALKTIQVFGKI